MKLTKSFECCKVSKKTGKRQRHTLEISVEVRNEEEANEISYDDFEVNLFIDGAFIAEISTILDRADAFMKMVDDVDWVEEYNNEVEENKISNMEEPEL